MARVLFRQAAAIPLEPYTALPSPPFAMLAAGSALATRHLLILRCAVLNMVATALLGAAWLSGWVDMAYEGDQTRLVIAIAGIFLTGLALCAWRIAQISDDINRVKAGDPPVELTWINPDVLKLVLRARIAAPRHIANSLVLLGLIGTVVGFIIALSGVVPDAAADVAAVGPMISTLIAGMAVALYTTLVGAVLNIWLMLNVRLLEGGCVALVVAVAEEVRRE